MRFGRRTRGQRATQLALALGAAALAVITVACAATPPATSMLGSAPQAIPAATPVTAAVPGLNASATRSPSPAGASSIASRGRTHASATPSGSPTPSQASSSPAPQAPSQNPQTSGPVAGAATRLVTFVNKTNQTIWVAAAPNPSTPLAATGWVLPVGGSVTISTPNNLNTRFWGRTGCVFNSAGTGHCQSGDCGGKFQCTGWGTIPATLAEVNFDAWDGLDFYDVSMVDGSNLPMYINTTGGAAPDKISTDGCVPAGCTSPVVCPSVLQVKVDGSVVGCISPCAHFNTDQYCCRGPWAPRADCDPAKWPVDYAAVFKKAEPYAYSYVDDDATSVFTCQGDCDYRITFGITP
ncbi:MAG TPA: thaumatin family protein [Trebonia sp.]|nr:thaumatin family protein [Trebonia sp.]